MKPSDRIMLAFLTAKGGTTARGCWWRQKHIAEETGLSLRTVQRAIARLEELKYIRVQHRFATTNLYFVDHIEKKQKALFFGGKVAWGYVKTADIINRTEVSTPKEEQRRSFPSKSEPGTNPRTPDDLAYREQFVKSLIASGCDLDAARPGLVNAMARVAHASGLPAAQCVQVYCGLAWGRIGVQHTGYIAAVFKGELEIFERHRSSDQSSTQNVSQPIAKKYWEPEFEIHPSVYGGAGVVAPTIPEPSRVSQRSLDGAIPLQEKEHGSVKVLDGDFLDLGRDDVPVAGGTVFGGQQAARSQERGTIRVLALHGRPLLGVASGSLLDLIDVRANAPHSNPMAQSRGAPSKGMQKAGSIFSNSIREMCRGA